MTNTLLLFIIYGFLGWIIEVLYVWVRSRKLYNRGLLHMPFLPIYAFGALAITFTLGDLQNVFAIYTSGIVVTTVLEYITSYIMERFFHTRWWDYSNYKFNINGRVCLLNSLLFGILAVVVILGLNPIFYELINSLDTKLKDVIVNLGVALLIIDLTYTLNNLNSLPLRDIRIISGKVKAYRDGKLRSLEELLDELSDLDDRVKTKVKVELDELKRNIHIKEELTKYSNKLGSKLKVNRYLTGGFALVILFALIGLDPLLLELILIVITIAVFTIVYNRHKHK